MRLIFLFLIVSCFSVNTIAQPTDTFKIPVVVHILWHHENEIWSRKGINGLIEHLNKGFKTEPEDFNHIRKQFHAVVGSPRIQFELAKTDFVGNGTIGIDYTYIPFRSTLFDSLHKVKSATTQGCSPWPTKKYLNIWICNIEQNERGKITTGYAPLPQNLKNIKHDGIVLHNDASTIYTAIIHETGHYLGLSHPWGRTPAKDCSSDDGLSDTPLTNGPSKCHSTQTGCGHNTQWENFMDYNSCGAFFTHQQVNQMHHILQQKRVKLTSSKQVKNHRNPSLTIPLKGPYFIPNRTGYSVQKIAGKKHEILLPQNRSFIATTIPLKKWKRTGSIHFDSKVKRQIRITLFHQSAPSKKIQQKIIRSSNTQINLTEIFKKLNKNNFLEVTICPEMTQTETPVYGQTIQLNFE